MSDKYLPVKTQFPLRQDYENKEFTFASGLTDYDFKANVSGAFVTLPAYTTLNIRSDQQISIRINSATNDAITIQANKPFELENKLLIKNIYLTNSSGSTANVKIVGCRQGDGD